MNVDLVGAVYETEERDDEQDGRRGSKEIS